jgi:hypothetical protein
MDRHRAPLLASPAQNPNKAEANHRPRRKLQKSGAKQRSYLAKRPASSEDSIASPKFDTAVKLVTQRAGVIGQPNIPLPPDLNDSKWLEYIRKSGFLCAVDAPEGQSKESLKRPVNTIPEFSHLAINDVRRSRPSLDRHIPDSPTSSTSTMSTMRRRAKTPVFTIGQLEGDSSAAKPPAFPMSNANKVSSVELIAEQYRALLEYRDDDSIYSIEDATHSEPEPERRDLSDGERATDQTTSRNAMATPPPDSGPTTQSPTSDDGTLVGFEEETVYFKPVSFSPEPLSPYQSYDSALSSPQPTVQGNLSLQICVDLLTRELTSAVSERRQRSSHDLPALQIWVMIEAYERLRDQILDMRMPTDTAKAAGEMLDVWLHALYDIHDSLTGDALTTGSAASDYDINSLGTEALD